MVNVTFHTGRYVGHTVDVAELSPKKLFATMVEEDWEWSLDYSSMSLVEKCIWKNWDFIARCGRALMKERTVTFEDVEYRGLEQLPVLEQALVDSPRNAVILTEDEDGIKIGSGDFKTH